MRILFKSIAYPFLLIFSLSAFSQQSEKKGFLRSTITVQTLKSAITIEELIENLPPDYEVVFYRLSLAGKDLQKIDWKPDNEKNVLNNTFQLVEAGQRIYIEYIEVKRKGSDSKPVHMQPRELVIIE
jgi:hypothetical protein